MHIPVLLHESIDALNIHSGDIVVDATINGGGHSEEIAMRWKDKVHIIGLDVDSDALKAADIRLNKAGARFTLIRSNFRNLASVITESGETRPSGVLFDLGMSSRQLDSSGRGFSFQRDETLLMTLSNDTTERMFTALEIVSDWSEENIATILRAYGDEQFANRIAKGIVAKRLEGPIDTTFKLRDVILANVPHFYKKGKTHPATRTFQALRITANDEIRALEEGLLGALNILAPGGRMAVISFHSVEDRIVKRFMRNMADEGHGIVQTKKPITPTTAEVTANPRSRSSKLRIFEKS